MKKNLSEIKLDGEFDSEPNPPCVYAKAIQRKDGKWIYLVTTGKSLLADRTKDGIKVYEALAK